MIRQLLILPLFILLCMIQSIAQVSPKRGMAYGYHSPQDLDAVKTGVSWWYNWSTTPDAAIASYYSSQGVEFVPMLWNDSYTVATVIASIPAGAKYILAFNEPNFTVESNMTPAQAVAAWSKIEAVAAARNLQIVSAVPAWCGGGVCIPGYTNPEQWHDEFFALCPTCKVDYIAFHNYEPTVGALTYLTGLLKKYNRPIWVTEFAYWDPSATEASKIAYLQAAVSAFENDPDIFRYSWFAGRNANNTVSILGGNGLLTNLGSAYIGAAYGPKNNIPGKIEVENVYRRKGTGLQATTDVGGGQNVGYTDPGTWNEYLVNISTTGNYTFKFRLASNVTGGSFDIRLDGVLVKSNVTVANTGGWQTWVDYDVTGIALTAGEHLLKFEFKTTGTNMNYFTTIFETIPTISSFTPNCGLAGTSVTITGTNLLTTTNVSFNGTAGTITSKTATQVVATAPAGVTSGLITVTTPTGSVSTTTNFNLKPVTSVISGAASDCANATGKNYSVTTTAGSTYNWSIPAGASITAGTNTNAVTVSFGTASGNMTVIETNAAGCVGATQTKAVTVNALPTVANAGPLQNITITTASLAGNTPSVGTGQWSLVSGSGTIATASLPATSVSALTVGTNIFRWTISNASCISSSDVSIVVGIPLGIDVDQPSDGVTQNYASDTYTLAPNPFTQSTHLKFNSSQQVQLSIKVIDMNGVCLFSNDDYHSNESIDLGAAFPNGMYTLVVTSSDAVKMLKMIKAE